MAEDTGPEGEEGPGTASYGMSQGGRSAVNGLIALSSNATTTATTTTTAAASAAASSNDGDTGPKRMFYTGAFG